MKHRVVLYFAATCFGAACTATDFAKQPAESPVQIPLRPYLGRLLTVQAVIAGDTLQLLFDTGGGETIISPKVATSIGCIPSGRSAAFRMSGERVDFSLCPGITLSLGGRAIAPEQVGVWDVQALLPPGAPPVDGVLSLKTFVDQPFSMELSAKRLILETAASLQTRVANMKSVRSRIATGVDGDELTVFLHGEVRGTNADSGWFLLDSGNLDAVQLAPHMRVLDSSVMQSRSADTVTAALTLDGWPAVQSSFRIRPLLYDGALSEAYLRNWTFSFDLAAGKVWAARLP
jgi:hypothetical protein